MVTSLVFVLYAVRGAELVLYALAAEQTLGLGTGGSASSPVRWDSERSWRCRSVVACLVLLVVGATVVVFEVLCVVVLLRLVDDGVCSSRAQRRSHRCEHRRSPEPAAGPS